MGAGVVLRALEPGDVPHLADLWVRSWQETLPGIDFAARRGWIVDFLAGPGAGTYATIVAADDDGLLGFVTIEPGAGYLHQLAVASAAKGRNVARLLMEAAKESSPGGLTLDVNEANTRAVRFYEREGFLVVGAGVNPGSGLPTRRMAWAL